MRKAITEAHGDARLQGSSCRSVETLIRIKWELDGRTLRVGVTLRNDISLSLADVRFTPESGHSSA
jgi:hypothetical protein